MFSSPTGVLYFKISLIDAIEKVKEVFVPYWGSLFQNVMQIMGSLPL